MASATQSDFLSDLQIKKLTQQIDYTPGTNMYLALFTTIPSLDGSGGVEVSTSGTAYARITIPSDTTNWTDPTGANREVSNKLELQFATPTANWGTIVGAGLFDASTGGNLLFTSSALSPKTVSSGDGSPKVLANAFKLSRAVC